MMHALRHLTLFFAVLSLSAAFSACSDGGNNEPDDAGTEVDPPAPARFWCEVYAPEVSAGEAPGCPEESDAPTQCEGDDRFVCSLGCVDDFNRSCFLDEHCRATEVCRLVDESSTIGTCLLNEFRSLCEEADDTDALEAGFATRDITPQGWELPRPDFVDGSSFSGSYTDPETFCDCGTDGICPPDEGGRYDDCPDFGTYTGPDADGSEGDGVMQSMWIAGFSQGRPALLCPDEQLGESCEGPQCCSSRLAHDPVLASAMVLRNGDTAVAYVVLDAVGYFYNDASEIRRRVMQEIDVDHVAVSATHTHEGPDTMGQWGPGDGLPVVTGFTAYWREFIYEQATDAVIEAFNNLEATDIYASNANTGATGFAFRDSRDPYIMDDNLTVATFVRQGEAPGDPNATLGTVVNWHNHPEALWSSNMLISSDFPHFVREYIREGLPADEHGEITAPAVDGVGGTVLYVTGIVGGLTTPGGASAIDRVGREFAENGFGKADAMGQRLAELALEGIRERSERMDESLVLRTREFLLPVVNTQLLVAVRDIGVLDREGYNARRGDRLDVRPPQVLTAVTRIQLGDLVMQTIPGEIFPELVVGFDGGPEVFGNPSDLRCNEAGLPDESSELPCIIRPENEYPPALDEAPTEGFLRQTLPGRYHIMIGLGEDELGYLVPSYDYVVAPGLPYLTQAPGSHYEETNSVADIVDEVLANISALYEEAPAED